MSKQESIKDAIKSYLDERARTDIIRKSKCSRVSKRKVHFTKRSV